MTSTPRWLISVLTAAAEDLPPPVFARGTRRPSLLRTDPDPAPERQILRA